MGDLKFMPSIYSAMAIQAFPSEWIWQSRQFTMHTHLWGKMRLF